MHSISNMVNEDQLAIVNDVVCPQLVMSTKDEPTDWKPSGLIEKTLAAKPFSGSNEFHLFAQEAHGFVTRGDTSIEHTKYAIMDVIDKMVSFVKKL